MVVLGRYHEDQVCSVARALEVLGQRWTLLIVRDLLLDVRRFDDLVGSLGITRSVLARRLEHLESHQVIERVAYQARPARYEYQLTPKGEELYGVLGLLLQWGDRHYPHPAGPPRLLRHAGCRGAVDGHLCCADCGAPLAPHDIETLPGPARTGPGTAKSDGLSTSGDTKSDYPDGLRHLLTTRERE